MLNDLFFLNIEPEELSNKAWKKLTDASEYYSNPASSAEWAIFVAELFEDVEFFILNDERSGEDFFAYLILENTPYDVSGFHYDHNTIIDDNEFYEDNGYFEVARRKANKDEVLSMMGDQTIDFLMNVLLVEE